MVQIPDVTPSYGALGNPAAPESNRPIVGYRAGGTEAAISQIGDDATKTADTLYHQQTELQVNTAKSNYMTDMVTFKDSPEEKNNPDTDGAPARWQAASNAAMKKYSNTITSPFASQMFQAAAPMEIKGFQNQYLEAADSKRRDMGKASILQQGDQASNNFLNTQDPSTQKTIVNTYLNSLDNAEKTGLISATERQNETARWTGQATESTVSKALTDGNVDYANRFYQGMKGAISGFKQAEIEKQLHGVTMQQTGQSNAQNLLLGKPLVPTDTPPGAVHARAAVADAAHDAGIDPNSALTVLRIESSDGINVGVRGDIGQTGKPGDLPTQASNLVGALKSANATATNALGRPTQPWEDYVVYQQGAGGGPALLKASNDPTANAVDVLKPYYKTSALALSAIKNNGGNATMNASQFVSMLQTKYQDNAQRSEMALPGSPTEIQAAAATPTAMDTQVAAPVTAAGQKPGEAILSAYKTTGPVMQQGATPVQSLNEMDKVYPDALNRANAIPNLNERDATLRALEQQHSIAQQGAAAWKTQFENQVENLATSPKFTSVSQIPPDMLAGLKDDPTKMSYLETRANFNLTHGVEGAGSKDAKEYGPGFTSMFLQIHSPAGGSPQLTDVNKVYQAMADGKVTVAGVDKLVGEMNKPKGPEGASEGVMSAQSLKVLKTQLSGEDKFPGMKDPKGEELYASALPQYFKAIEDGKAKGVPMGQLLNPSSKDWAGNSVHGMVRDPATYYADLAGANMNDNGTVAEDPNNPKEIKGWLWNSPNPDYKPPATAEERQVVADFSSGKYTADSNARIAGIAAIKNAVAKGMPRERVAELLAKYPIPKVINGQ